MQLGAKEVVVLKARACMGPINESRPAHACACKCACLPVAYKVTVR